MISTIINGKKKWKHTLETKEKQKCATLEQFKDGMPQKTKDKIKKKLTGRKQSKEHIEKNRIRQIGQTVPPSRRKKISKGVLKTLEERPEISKIISDKAKQRSFEKYLNINSFASKRKKIISILHGSQEMKNWKKKVLARDSYKCVSCNSKRNLNVDHIKKFINILDENIEKIIDLNFEEILKINAFWDINNGRVLCEECHRYTFTYGNRKTKKKINYMRQMDIFNPILFNEDVSIVGLGSIGSNTALCLARLGIKNIHIVDHDIVSAHNLPNQCYNKNDINRSKTFCLAETLKVGLHSNIIYNQKCPQTKFDGSKNMNEYLIIAVDSMNERKKIAKQLKKAIIKPKKVIQLKNGKKHFQTIPTKIHVLHVIFHICQ